MAWPEFGVLGASILLFVLIFWNPSIYFAIAAATEARERDTIGPRGSLYSTSTYIKGGQNCRSEKHLSKLMLLLARARGSFEVASVVFASAAAAAVVVAATHTQSIFTRILFVASVQKKGELLVRRLPRV